MLELVIKWSTGDKDIYEYGDMESAEKAEAGMHMAFGNQIAYSCVRRKVTKNISKEAMID